MCETADFVIKRLNEIEENLRTELSAANAKIAELERKNAGLREGLRNIINIEHSSGKPSLYSARMYDIARKLLEENNG